MSACSLHVTCRLVSGLPTMGLLSDVTIKCKIENILMLEYKHLHTFLGKIELERRRCRAQQPDEKGFSLFKFMVQKQWETLSLANKKN